MTLITAVRNGGNYILHSCGMMGGYIGNSFEKWLIDEELCGMVRRMMKPLDFSSEATDTGIIGRVGMGGNYLTQPETLKLCRTAYFDYALFSKGGQNTARDIVAAASDKSAERLGNYDKPEIDPEVESLLHQYVDQRKASG